MPSYPSSGVSQVFGLLDVLRAYTGKTSVAKLNMDLHLDIDDLLPPIATAELLELVTVKDGEISLTESGRKILSRSEEHTSELQSRLHLVCRLLLEKKKKELRPRTQQYTQMEPCSA